MVTTSSQRVPWWLWVVVGSFLAYYGLIVYCETIRLEPIGVSLSFGAAEPVVMSAIAGSPMEQAGLRPGDRILRYDGYPIRSRLDLMVADANLEVGEVLEIELNRAGQHLTRTLPLRQLNWREGAKPEQLVLITARLIQLVPVALAILVAWRRPRDPVARIGVWMLACGGVFSVVLPYSLAARWHHLPMPIGLLLWIPFISSVGAAAVLFTFCAVFPRPLFTSRWLWIAAWAPMIVALAWHVTFAARMVYAPARAIGMTDWSGEAVVIAAGYAASGLILLVLNYRRLTDLNERRRVRVLVVGASVGSAGAALIMGRYWLNTGTQVTDSYLGSPEMLIGTLLALAIPLSFTYAILRHRLFDVAVIIRQGVRYALARGVLVSLVPALAVVVVADLLMHRSDTLATTLSARGWVYAVIGGIVFVAQQQRVAWLDALDRRFFRERYDAQQLLRQLATDLQDRADVRHVASRVVAQIQTALHPEFAAVLTCDARQREYRPLVAAPAGLAPPPLPADSKLMGLVRILGKPMEIGRRESSWLAQQLPEHDTDYLRDARIDLIVPIAVDPAYSEAILVLGPKRSEEPYSREDLDLLATIAGNLALVLDRRTETDSGAHAFEECPRCGVCYDTGAVRCAHEGAPLQTTRLPRVLAARYRLERRLGMGGMGTVYAATDSALDRPVAAKVLRDDLVESAEAAERFKREARTAASFAHPNVVTVHDFGITSDHRAFLVMELLAGRTLRDEMTDRPQLGAPRAIAILRDVCAAVDAAHRRQILHRDLKPENIFLVRDEDRETAKVLDFGIAKALDAGARDAATSVTGAHQLLGTLAYMAPEQLRGEDAHPAWDIWALTIVAYEILTGAHPFARQAPALMAVDALRGRATSIRDHLGSAPASWGAFFDRALAVDADRRPQSVRTFLSELEQALASAPA